MNKKQERHLQCLQILSEKGYQYISGEYETSSSKYTAICSNGHLRETNIHNYKRYDCNECANNKRSEKHRLDIEVVLDTLSHGGYVLVGEYINKDKPMETICPNNHLYKVTLGNFKSGRRCQICKDEKVYSLEEAKNEFNKYDLIPMFTEVNSKSEKLPFLCPIHNDHGLQFVSLTGLRRKDYRCKFCCDGGMKKGEKHHNWKGGNSIINEYLRRSLYYSWILPSLKEYDFKCVITGMTKANLVVHHLNKNFSEISQETFKELNIKIKQNLCDYDENTLILLKNKCLELHMKYGLGVPLINDVHKLFHHLYGVNNNNIDQFEEFRVRWNFGEFETLFDENFILLKNFKRN